MEGRAKTLPQNTTIFTLNNNSNWHLKISLFELENSFSLFDYTLLDLKQRAQSVVSVLNLNDSSIIFDAPHKLADNHYQTLHIGRHPQKQSKTEAPMAQQFTMQRATQRFTLIPNGVTVFQKSNKN